jgi:hypothetical protein
MWYGWSEMQRDLTGLPMTRPEIQTSHSRCESRRCQRWSRVPLAFGLGFRLMQARLIIAGSVQILRNSCDKALIIREAVTNDDHTLGGVDALVM